MEASENSNDASLSDSFLTGQTQYVVEGQDEDNIKDEGDLPDNEPLREQDRFLPIANVAKIMKKSIPPTGKIAKDAKECVQECVSEFISFITSEASDRCHQEKRKTINGEDILFAMSTLGFDNYVEPLKVYLQKYRESTKGDKMNAEAMVEDLGSEDTFNAATLNTGILTAADQSGQQNVIYAPTYSTQISQQQINYT